MKNVLVALSLSMCIGCTAKAPVTWRSTEGAEPAGAVDRARSPIQAQLSTLSVEAGRTVLRLRVDKTIKTERDLSATVRLPKGAGLDDDTGTWPLAADQVGTFTHDFSIRYGSLPGEDLHVVVSVQQPDFGYHAELPYRFGRPETTSPPLRRTAEEVKVGDQSLGHPIDLSGNVK